MIMRHMLDGEWINHIFASSDAEFNNRLAEVVKPLDFRTATKADTCKAIVNVLCDEVSGLCQALKAVCEASGYGEYYESHISHERFVRLVLSVDTTKTGRMLKIVNDGSMTPIDVLRGVGAILNDEPLEERAALDARERRRANAELKSIAADVKTTMQLGFDRAEQKMIECTSEVKAIGVKVDAVDAKVSKLRRSGKSRGRYTKEVREVCWSCWVSAANHEEVWRSVNTRITYEAVFNYCRARLERVGVKDSKSFRDIIRAEDKRRSRELAAQRDVAENGIIRDVKKTTTWQRNS